MSKGFEIAIDGPVAAGKGTVAVALAEKLGGLFLYTGAMYRSVALLCIERGLDLHDEASVVEVLSDTNIEYRDEKIFLNDKDITDRIKLPDTANGSSVVSRYWQVRRELVKKQQLLAQHAINQGKVVIAEGRDIGTRVLPSADLKIFLTSSLETRARRGVQRYKGQRVEKNLEEVIEETKERDRKDYERRLDPLPRNPAELGYWVIDNSEQTEEETVNLILNRLKEKGLINDTN